LKYILSLINGIQEVGGSIPPGSTKSLNDINSLEWHSAGLSV